MRFIRWFALWLLAWSATRLMGSELVKPVCVGNAVVGLYDDGHIAEWNLATRQPDQRLAAALQALAPVGIDADEGSFWIYDGHRVVEWNESAIVGRPQLVDDARDAPLLNFFHNDSGSFAVYAGAIVNLGSGKRHDVPMLGGQLRVNSLRPLCYAKGTHTIWVGTGQGEWGGHLVCFDTEQGAWASFYDSLHYVTGIALVDESPRLVAWSMSHFYASTILRVHRDDATPEKHFEEHEGQYYQTVAHNPFDDCFYVVEQDQILIVDDRGGTTPWAKLPKFRYRGEAMAIGAVPGVQSVVPVARDEVLVFFYAGPPALIYRGEVLPLAEAGSTIAGTPSSQP